MRDLFLMTAILGMLVALLRKPQIGILAWVWISVMNPHREAFGWIYDYPLLDVVAGATLISVVINWHSRCSARFHPIIALLGVFYCWTTLTMVFGVEPDLSYPDWLEFSKTLLLVVLILLFMNKRHWTLALIAVFILSIGFTGLKGGVFTVLTGGSYRVWGAPGTAWGDNNGVSMAMLMVIPITFACRELFSSRLARFALIGCMVSFFFALLGTQSRGGLVGLLGMVTVLILRSQKKAVSFAVMGVLLTAGYMFMPQSWHERMHSIRTASDGSSQTRLIQWQYAIDISLERPFFGNGFDAFFHQPYYHQYVAHKDINRSVHSNYFQVLGEQGYIGLAMYLVIGISLLHVAQKYSKRAAGRPDLKWQAAVLESTQYGIAGYAFNGLTVNMAYLDLYYLMLTFVILLMGQIRTALADQAQEARLPAARARPVLRY